MDITEEVIYHLSKNIKTKLAVSSVNGVGVFAITNIRKGEEVFTPWEFESGIYAIPNDKMKDIPANVLDLLNMYFINEECGYKIIRLFNGFNFLFHGTSYCNSSWPNKENQNISNNGTALKDIMEGDEILEWYTQNINLADSK